jgi:hypothetical protein
VSWWDHSGVSNVKRLKDDGDGSVTSRFNKKGETG